MVLGIGTQLLYFFSTVIAGFIAGAVFDIYRVIKGDTKSNKIMTAISDILFWVFEAFIVFLFLAVTNNGDIRYYTFVGIILGLFIYFKFLSKKSLKIFRNIFMFSGKFIRIVLNIVLIPFKIILYIIGVIRIKITSINYEKNKLKKNNQDKKSKLKHSKKKSKKKIAN